MTLEEIASKAVDAIIASTVSWAREEIGAGVSKELYRAAVLTALREATAPPAPSPVSEERLAEVKQWRDELQGWLKHDGVLPYIDDLLDHIDHQDALIRAMQGEPEGEAFRDLLAAERRRGREEMREACVEAAKQASGRVGSGSWAMIAAVEKAEVSG